MLFANEVKTFTCICCPMGCQLEATFDDDGTVSEVTGFACNRGKAYAEQEAVDPVRMITAVVCVAGCLEPMSVKTADPVPKARISEVLDEIRTLELHAPIQAGSVLIGDVAGTGVPVIATKTVERQVS
jgi:CxxC motif-containing protein